MLGKGRVPWCFDSAAAGVDGSPTSLGESHWAFGGGSKALPVSPLLLQAVTFPLRIPCFEYVVTLISVCQLIK